MAETVDVTSHSYLGIWGKPTPPPPPHAHCTIVPLPSMRTLTLTNRAQTVCTVPYNTAWIYLKTFVQLAKNQFLFKSIVQSEDVKLRL